MMKINLHITKGLMEPTCSFREVADGQFSKNGRSMFILTSFRI